MSEFNAFPKIPRLGKDMIVTEKIDGTNAQIVVTKITMDSKINPDYGAINPDYGMSVWSTKHEDWFNIRAGSRNRWVTTEDDNYGFANWVHKYAMEILKSIDFKTGTHYGEWWGQGIQRNYNMKTKMFSLFRPYTFFDPRNDTVFLPKEQKDELIEKAIVLDVDLCPRLAVVPVLYAGPFCTRIVDDLLAWLKENGSLAAPECGSYCPPEGVMVYHEGARQLFKATYDGPKWKDLV